MVQQEFHFREHDNPQPIISTLHMVIMAGQRIGSILIDGWGPLETLEFTRLLDEVIVEDEYEESHLQWPEN